ncbi:hypothetical protein GDO81_018888 [Engystomops pustulosus]|uniref:Uncharacterized protein n=1 Tax=Engystomops pustulosus TaxID=76066 RepID=A0AAV6ZG81_ENGPU|nr:hypothetical protein GDO81_018888 [Engystomops pustulosus]
MLNRQQHKSMLTHINKFHFQKKCSFITKEFRTAAS